MMVKLKGRKCVVVGAGKVAEGKIDGLLADGAEISVVSPRATARIQKQARAGILQWQRRGFSASDVEGAFLVVAATNSSQTNSKIFQACRKRGILCNAVDDPENCDFFYPAIVRRGALQIAISTHGFSPALASRLRQELEQQFGPEWEDWLEEIGDQRREILRQDGPAARKRKRLMQIASSKSFQTFLRRRNSPRGTQKSKAEKSGTRK
jgi:precorrin-2 dehydrogenase/sirohydrochlorin ferrochelatase